MQDSHATFPDVLSLANAPCHYVVGIGASAGGLEAIERFFDHMSADSGLSFILVQHLSPDFRSLMDELLARHTDIAIHRVTDGMPVAPNAIYLIPPKKNMFLSEGRLLLTDQDQKSGLNLPIDIFFRSLAQDVGDKAIAVILSGTGTDGSRGAKEIHEAGGLVIAQEPETAAFDGMPRAAIATGLADFVLAPEAMPDKLLQYVRHRPFFPDALPQDPSVHEDELGTLFALLRRKFGVDFTLYKPGTIARRLERRMKLLGVSALTRYVRSLEETPEELDALYRDLLVEVTQFFRDREAFEILRREVIPLLCDQTKDGELRVWVPGCATGEEAYSLAMLFHEQTRSRPHAIDVKIFATDVHRASLEVASTGIYGEQSVSELPDDFQTRYFSRRRDHFVVAQEIRHMVIFAPHNLTKDPPFTKLDLISCRNVLIYLNSVIQKKILTLFHFGLKTGGVLFLGPSESVADLETEFDLIDGHWKVFRKQRDARFGVSSRLATLQPLSETTLQIRERLDPLSRERGGLHVPEAFELLLQRFVPPSLLINEQHHLLHSFGDARKFLQVPEGKATSDVLRMLEPGLRIALSSALHRASKEQREVVYTGLRTRLGDFEIPVKLMVLPLPERRSRSLLYLVCLHEDVETPTPVITHSDPFDYEGEAAQRIRDLERELTFNREHLQSTIEELETSNEELQATNEELVASNEELQSTNEELHSVNEELYTVNAEHQRKIDELTQLTTDMDNLLGSTDIGTLFLDSHLNIRKFTPAIGRIFNLLPQDIGRPLRHISSNISIEYEKLHAWIEQTLASGQASEQELPSVRTDTFLMRVHPYKTSNNVLTGAVLTFIDITATKETERALQSNQRRLKLALEAGHICTWQWDLAEGSFTAGQGLKAFFELPPGQVIHSFEGLVGLLHPQDRPGFRDVVQTALDHEPRIEIDCRRVRPDGSVGYLLTRADIDRDEQRRPVRMVGVCIDVTERHEMRSALQESQQLLQAILDNSSAAIFAKDRQGRYLFMNHYLMQLHDLDPRQILGKTDEGLFPPAFAATYCVNDAEVLVTEAVLQSEATVRHNDGEHAYVTVKFPLRDAQGQVYGIGGIATDITLIKRAETEVREALTRRDHFLAMLSHELRNPLGAILNAIYVLQEAASDDLARQDAVAAVERQATQMARLLDDLLDVSRIAQNKVALREEPVALQGVIREALSVAQPLFSAGRLQLEVTLPEEPCCVYGDAVRLQQILINLLTNAVKYTPDEGTIRVALEHAEGEAVLRVADTGIGIAPSMLDRIFDMFVQAHDTFDRRNGGLGVGLTLVQKIVTLHGGSVRAYSAGAHQGSEFVVRLPLTAQAPTSATIVPCELNAGEPLRVVVVEDNADSRQMLETYLRLEGFDVRSAEDGQQGVKLIREFMPVLAFVDLGLPILDGYQLATAVRQQQTDPQVYLVALTGYGRSEDRQAVIAAGFDAHLVKPPRREELAEVLEHAAAR